MAGRAPVVRVIARSLDDPRDGRPTPPPTPLACTVGDPAMAAFGKAVADACARVYEVLDRLWCAREAVKDRWTARLYGPPILTSPPAGTTFLAAALTGQSPVVSAAPAYDGRDARTELAAVAAARAQTRRVETDFVVDIRDAVNTADAAATRGDHNACAAAETAVRHAADTAIAGLHGLQT